MDIAIVWDPTRFRGDWSVTSGDLLIGNDLETAVLLSLFTDRVASPDYLPPAGSSPDRHGWWGDTYEPSLLGSRLWQLNRAKKTSATQLLTQAADYCRESLQWLLDDGVAAAVNVQTGWITADAIGIKVQITQPGGLAQSFDYQWAWNEAPTPKPPVNRTLSQVFGPELDGYGSQITDGFGNAIIIPYGS